MPCNFTIFLNKFFTCCNFTNFFFSAPHPNSTSTNQIATDLSKKPASTSVSGLSANAAANNSRESAYDFSLSNEQHTLGENLSIRKDSPAKIIPLSTATNSSR